MLLVWAMTHLLAVVALLFACADHWTTYLCLRAPVRSWEVIEANPLAAWAFERFGLVEGLLLDSVVTVVALLLVVRTPLFNERSKLAALGILILTSSYAVDNNLDALHRIGLSITGATL